MIAEFFFFLKEFLMTPSSDFKALDLLPKDIKYDLGILKVKNFAIFVIFDNFCEILYLRKLSKPQNCEIKYQPSLRSSFS